MRRCILRCLILVYTVCSDLCVRIHTVNTLKRHVFLLWQTAPFSAYVKSLKTLKTKWGLVFVPILYVKQTVGEMYYSAPLYKGTVRCQEMAVVHCECAGFILRCIVPIFIQIHVCSGPLFRFDMWDNVHDWYTLCAGKWLLLGGAIWQLCRFVSSNQRGALRVFGHWIRLWSEQVNYSSKHTTSL